MDVDSPEWQLRALLDSLPDYSPLDRDRRWAIGVGADTINALRKRVAELEAVVSDCADAIEQLHLTAAEYPTEMELDALEAARAALAAKEDGDAEDLSRELSQTHGDP